MSIVSGMPSIAQKRAAHGPGAITTCSPTSIGALARLDSGDRAVVARGEAGDLDALEHRDALGEALVPQPEHGLDVEREPALVLVQADRHALRAPVGEERLHVRVDLGLAVMSSER